MMGQMSSPRHPLLSASILKEKAQARAIQTNKKLAQKHPKAHKKINELQFHLRDLRRHSAKMISGALLASGLMLGTPTIQKSFSPFRQSHAVNVHQHLDTLLHNKLMLAVPKHSASLTPVQEQAASDIIKEVLGLTVSANLDGHRLNQSYGRIGGEQHLPRYPGDSIGDHDELQVKGITAGRGAFGYFAHSKESLTPQAELQEKYYVAVQTMYLPHWNTNYKDLKEWYKFRKVLVVNPTNGKSVVAVIGDAGPAAWTGKQFGGSPEVMEHLKPYDNKNNGMVLLYFLDESEQPIALGPITQPASQYIAYK